MCSQILNVNIELYICIVYDLTCSNSCTYDSESRKNNTKEKHFKMHNRENKNLLIEQLKVNKRKIIKDMMKMEKTVILFNISRNLQNNQNKVNNM